MPSTCEGSTGLIMITTLHLHAVYYAAENIRHNNSRAVTHLVLMMSLNDTVAEDRPFTPQCGTPDDPSPRLQRDDPDGLNDTSAWTSNL